jgi:hypothetical protein
MLAEELLDEGILIVAKADGIGLSFAVQKALNQH